MGRGTGGGGEEEAEEEGEASECVFGAECLGGGGGSVL